MAEIIIVPDLPASLQEAELVEAMVDGANAKASRVAPCLTWDGSTDDQPVPTPEMLAEARLVLIGTIKRWVEAGSGALSQQTAGPFGQVIDTRQKSSGYNLWPSEIEALQQICSTGSVGREAFSIDAAPTAGLAGHSPYCDLMFGGTTCSCGFSLTGVAPIYEPY